MTDADALELLSVVLGAGGQGFLAVTTNDDRRDVFWLPLEARERFCRLVPKLAWERDADVTAIPLAHEGSFRLHGRAGCVWARSDTGASTARLRRFRPLPTLVLREGSSVRYVALWAVRKALEPDDAARVSRHLAHKLGTPKKHATSGFTFRPPGGVIRHGRGRPVPIVVAGGSGEAYSMRELCRTLPRTLPDTRAWMSSPRRERAVPSPVEPAREVQERLL